MRHLLLLLGMRSGVDADGLTRVELPRLKDISAIVDTAPETASRIISAWRRQDVLRGDAPAQVAFEREQFAGVHRRRDQQRHGGPARSAPPRDRRLRRAPGERRGAPRAGGIVLQRAGASAAASARSAACSVR